MSASVTVQCAGCKATKEIGPGEVAPGDFPMCSTCYLPMCAVEAKVRPRTAGLQGMSVSLDLKRR